MEKESTTYNLCSTARQYRDETVISYYFRSNKKIIKKYTPCDIDGERYRLNLTTGDIEPYNKKQILESYGASLRRTTILMNELLSMNDFDWFWTLTFDKEKIDRRNDREVFNAYGKYINNIKKQYPNFRYMCFPERHEAKDDEENGCIHFHLLTGGLTAKQMGLVNSGKVCCHWARKNGKKTGICSKAYFDKTKDDHLLVGTDGETIYNITTFAYGYTTVSRIVSRERCNSYVKKYVEKALGSTEVFKKRFYYSTNLKMPEVTKTVLGNYDHILDIDKVPNLKDDILVSNSKGQPYVNDYNVMQIKVDNELKQCIDMGLIPLELVEDYQIKI